MRCGREDCPICHDDRCCITCKDFSECDSACLLPSNSCKYTIKEEEKNECEGHSEPSGDA